MQDQVAALVQWRQGDNILWIMLGWSVITFSLCFQDDEETEPTAIKIMENLKAAAANAWPKPHEMPIYAGERHVACTGGARRARCRCGRTC